MSAFADAAERRCGWLRNPGPANWVLEDRDAPWDLRTQGRPFAPGMLPVTGMTDRDWVRPLGGPYGYGCACRTVDADPAARRVPRIRAATAHRALRGGPIVAAAG
nr:DUF4087 domain-containing protein [Neoroseomonas alba]